MFCIDIFFSNSTHYVKKKKDLNRIGDTFVPPHLLAMLNLYLHNFALCFIKDIKTYLS